VLARAFLCFVLGSLVLCAADVTATASGGSGLSLTLTYPSSARFDAATLLIQATDTDGLDELSITSAADDLKYQTELARSGPSREFKRSFRLTEVFPFDRRYQSPMNIEVTVKNIKGKIATVKATIQLEK
jgi:hypothetical protein